MKIFRYKADIIPTSLIILLLIIDFIIYSFSQNIILTIVWMLIGLAPKACICSWNHHHQHVHTFYSNLLNRLLEIVYAFHTGITTNAWVLHHVLGHHINYLDQNKDESRWKRKDGKIMNALEYTLSLAITGYPRAFNVGRNYKKIQKIFLSMGFIVTILVSILLYINWLNTIILFIIPMLVGYLITCWHTYYHHAGLDTDNHHEASYNIIHKWYNILTGNLGYHTAHHIKMGLHWSKLPEYHSEISDKIDPKYYVEPCIPFKWMPKK